MNNKTKHLLIYGLALLAVLLVGGVSYAYFVAQVDGIESVSTIYGESGEMSITFADNNPNITATGLTPDSTNAWATKTFTVTGTSTVKNKVMPYTLTLVVDTNELTKSNMSYTLESTNTSNNGSNIQSVTSQTEIKGDTVLGTGYFEEGTDVIHTYVLKIYYPDSNRVDQSDDMEKGFTAHVLIEAEKAGNLLNQRILSFNSVTNTLTSPGKESSTLNEALLASTPDDYGTSYYFRGAVENNYIVFANMCWRIVRVDGAGNTKLTLYNYNPNNVENPCDSSQDGTTNAFARYNGDTYTSMFNDKMDDNVYIGFMYGDRRASTYSNAQANNNNSTILNNLKTWYDSKLLSYSNQLADTIWCNDKSLSKNPTYGTSLGYGANSTQYSGATRLNTPASASPSLICPNDESGGNLSRFTVHDTIHGNGKLYQNEIEYKIGLLTADEIAYAGGSINPENNSYYLYKNTNGAINWWTMTPMVYEESSTSMARVFSVDSIYPNGLSASAVQAEAAIRPVVALTPQTMVTGVGTSSNPYKV